MKVQKVQRSFSLLCILLSGWSCFFLACDNQESSYSATLSTRFKKVVFDNQAYGATFSYIVDLDGDGRLDILTSHFGPVIEETRTSFTLPPGEISVYYQGESFSDWRREVVLSRQAGVYLPQELRTTDIDGDGDLDIGVGTGFLLCGIFSVNQCGGVLWFEQTEEGWRRHDVLPPTQRLFYHTTLFTDLDGDGVLDLITVAEDRRIINGATVDVAETQWFRGDLSQESRFDPTPNVIGPGMGSLFELIDLDGDGDQDIVSGEYFAYQQLKTSFAWYEQVEAPTATTTGTWVRHVIDDQSGPTIQGSIVEDFLGDGKRVLIGSNHTNTLKYEDDPRSAVFVYQPTDDLKQPWKRTQISREMISSTAQAGQAAPGIFDWGDLEGDGDLDLIVSGDSDNRIFLIEQKEGTFITHVLDEGIAQAGGCKIVDLDQDGKIELLVNDFETNEMYLYIQDPSGTYPVQTLGEAEEAEPRPEVLPKSISLSIDYEGFAQGTLRVLLYEGDELVGEPIQRQDFEQANFTQSVSFQGLEVRPYTVQAYLDLGAPNETNPGQEDIVGSFSLIPPSSAPSVILLGAPQDTGPEPTGNPGDVTINIELDFDGQLPPSGNLIIGLYKERPITGPPEFPKVVSTSSFPMSVTLPQVRGGRYFAYGFFDLPPENTFQPGAEDPVGESEFFVVDGNQSTSVTLKVP